MELDEQSKDFLTINTHQGLYKPNRLHYGLRSATSIFQRVMEELLAGLQGDACYLDNIIIMVRSEKEHFRLLEEVLNRLDKAGVRLKEDKCNFFQNQVEYLGHIQDARGLHPTGVKVNALQEAATPGSKLS